MTMRWDQHPPDEALELYTMGRLSGAELEALEEHLLICEHCQDRQQETDLYVATMREAAARLRQEDAESESFRRRKPWQLVWLPRLAGAGVLAAALLILLWLPRTRTDFTSAPVIALATTRSLPETPTAWAPSGKPFLLQVDLTDLPPVTTCRIEIVNTSGRTLWKTTQDAQKRSLRVPVSRRLAAGRYWVRLYAPDEELLREYALAAR